MATATPLKQSEAVLKSLREQTLDALKVMFQRANDPHTTEGGERETLTDCEFGMILLLTNAWSSQESFENEFYAAIDKSDYDRVVPNLVGNVVSRVLPRKQDHEGGEGINQICFFTGEPYTKYLKAKNIRYSAHLDAAMITVIFLALAVEQFNKELVERPHADDIPGLPEWVNSLRDAALFVILEGLQYAKDCRVIHNSKFVGFTSDPISNKAQPENGGLEKEYDRLFFTWTACETINDMKSWTESYLESDIPQPPPPAKARDDISALINELRDTLSVAADWCADHFLPAFEKFAIEDTKDVIRQVNQFKGARFDEHLQKRVNATAEYVQYVYHFSQYAAIRSLAPERLTLEEVRIVADKLDRLVQSSIMTSGLDDSEQENLFGTLTRTYSLADSNANDYTDDAWYPLVVRSISGLLSRTLSDFRGRYSRSEVQALTLMFQRSLEVHLTNLLTRRPKIDRPGDEKLWSFASDQDYALYATQRTLFALMQYAAFVKAVDRFQSEPDVDRREEELSLLVARKLATDYFRPVIRELLASITPPPVTIAAPVTVVHANVPLPEEEWAAEALRACLAKLNNDFKESQITNTIDSMAGRLSLVKLNADGYQPSPGLNDPKNVRKKNSALQQLEALKREYDKIRETGELGKKLSDLEVWNKEKLKPILFGHLIDNYLQRFNSIERLVKDEPTDEWKLISDAIQTCESISNLDPEGTLS